MGTDRAAVGAAEEPVGIDTAVLQDVISALQRIAQANDRADLAVRLDEAAWRVARTETLVCVVGEFKKGKSALINALLEQDVCPVDDDLSTAAVTLVRHDDRPSVTVRRRSNGRSAVETIELDDVADWVVEREDPEERRDVVLVEIGLPHPLLERGMALVDTPGVGGLNAAHAVATLAFLPSADALVFVTDASAELTAPELEFLSRAIDAGPPVLVAMTKIDMYPEWRRIVALDEGHLQTAGIDLEVLPVSSVLRAAARAGDATLAEASRVPGLLEAILGTVSDAARVRAVATAVAEVGPAIDQLREPLATELAALEHPERAAAMAEHLRIVRDRLAVLAAADANWSTRLSDEFEGLKSQVGFDFQAKMRQRLREAHDELERIDPARDWQDLSLRFQMDVATIVRGAFVETTDGAARIQAKIADMLTDDETGMAATDDSPVRFDVAELWKDDPTFGGRASTRLLGSVGVAAGAAIFGVQLGTVGIEMLGLLGTLLGAAVIGPAVVGAALIFGGKQVIDERRRQLSDRRQEARSFLTRFVEDVRFEVDGRLGTLSGDLQRQMRAHYADRIHQLQRTNEEGAESLERAAEQDAAERQARIETLHVQLTELDELSARIDEPGSPSVAFDVGIGVDRD